MARWSEADQRDAALRQAWTQDGVPLLGALRAQARALLTLAHDGTHLLVDAGRPGREILRWRQVSLRVPVGTMLAAAAPPGVRPALDLRLLTPDITPEGPIALQHVHYKAACDFETLWAWVMARRAPLPAKDEGWVPAGFDRARWCAVLGRARAARRWLAAWLDGSLAQRAPWRDGPATGLLGGFGSGTGELPGWLRRFARGDLAPAAGWIERGLWSETAVAPGTAPTSPWAHDALADGGDWPEGRLLARLIDRLADATGDVALLAVQYLRVRGLLHAHLVHDPAAPGLGSFVDVFRRLSPYRQGLPDGWLLDGLADEPELDMGSIEARTGPPDQVTSLARGLASLDDAPPPHEFGFVFHFARSRGGPLETWRAAQREAERLRAALLLRPERLRWVRGLDVAGHESAGPLWVLLDVLRDLRADVQDRAARARVPAQHLGTAARSGRSDVQDRAARARVQGLRLSVHAGEDFVHLLTGLRAVDEPFAWGLMRRGDRLGHALALGRDPDSGSDRVSLPAWRRLLDLDWAIERIAARRLDVAGGPLRSMVAERRALSRTLGLDDDGVGLHAALGRPGLVHRLIVLQRPADAFEALVARWLAPRGADSPFDAPVEVDVAAERPVVAALQQDLVEQVARWGTVIEVNPSSNLVIAELGQPVDQPIFRMRPVGPLTDHALPVSVNTDDPLTFATRLADEYAYAWAGLVESGVSPGHALAWMNEAARAGWRARFTLPPRTVLA
ncbi:MAG: hypothetical protein H6704_22755 [Myxococcales bacterium]|nr:hypothetical protein [Myxococcales bacterium]